MPTHPSDIVLLVNFVTAGAKSFFSHFNENPIYVFPGKELRALSPNFHIYVSVSDF
jgi:hypothetical protein